MKKSDYAKTHGLKVRKATSEDRKQSNNNEYAKTAQIVITDKHGKKWLCQNGTLKDMKFIVDSDKKPKNAKKSVKKRSKTASKSKKR